MTPKRKQPPSGPPQWVDKFLERLCAPHLLEEVLGDLHERYYLRVQREGESSARSQYWQEALSYLRPYLLKRKSPYATTLLFTDMLKNYFTIATRNLSKYKGFSTINITGLGLGMACCMLLVLFIQYELSYDTYHKNYSRIFRMTYLMSSGEHKQNIKSPEPLARTLQAEIPQVIKAGRLFPYQDVPVRVEDGHFIEQDLYAADQEILDIFSFRVKSGDPSGLLKDPASVVLNQTTARKYFKEKDPVGKTLHIFNQPMRVTGVIEDMPSNSHFHANLLISYNSFPQSTSDNWGWTDPRTYFLVKEGVTPDAITRRMPALAKKHGAEYFTFKAEPLSAIHLYSNMRGELEPNGNIAYLYIMGAIAAFILGIACINFVNLSTARATLRGKEVGMRKTMGAVRSQLVTQFLGESFLLTFLAFVLALVAVSLALPSLNGLMGKAIEFNLAQHGDIVLIFTAIFFAVGLVSGLYPAFYLSRFRPILVLKGKNHPQGSSARIRRGLVVFQFAVAIVLTIGTLTVLSQLHYLQSKHLGFNQEQVVVVPLRTTEAVRKYEALRNAVGQQPLVTSVSGASEYPGREHPMYSHWAEGAPQEQSVLLSNGAVGFGYFQTMEMELKAGRYFSEAFPSDEQQAVVINEEAAKLLGYGQETIGKKIYHAGPSDAKREWRTVVGIVKNFHSHSLHVPIEPLFIIPRKEVSNLMVRVQTGEAARTLAAIEAAFRKINPDLPFEASFLDQEFARAYRAEERLSALVKTFTFLAILISCLGLLGLISFTVDQKMKEIGVRKVLGAQAAHLVYLLSKESLLYVGLAWLVASPVAYLLMDKWLQGYPYRIALKPGTFILAGVAALTVAFLTISYQTLKAARSNPVRWLRNE